MTPAEVGALPRVTIMIPTYRQAGTILRAIDSALAQDYPHLEVIVADDASPDNTADVVAGRTDPRLAYHRNQTNLGRAGNYRHTLYSLAHGDWVVNLDGDDYFTDPAFISSAVQLVAQDPDIVIVAARCLTETPTRRTASDIPAEQVVSGTEVVQRLTDERYRFMHMATLYHRTRALACDFYRRDLVSTDWESLYRLAVHGRVAYLDRIIGVWRLHGENESLTTDGHALVENLSIWQGIYEEAVACGVPSASAGRAKSRIRFDLAYFYASSVIRVQGVRGTGRYLAALHQADPRLCLRLATYYKLAVKLVLALLPRPLQPSFLKRAW